MNSEIKCSKCKNYHQKEGCCSIDEIRSVIAVNQINEIWGLTFQDCTRFEVKNV